MKLPASIILVSAVLVAGCSSANKPRPVGGEAHRAAPAPAVALTPSQHQAIDQAQQEASALRFDDEILRLCPGVQGPRFEYDSHAVGDSFRQSLVVLADCAKTGALKESQLLMIGHADPRGEEDYNFGLGGRRADAVRSALTALGVEQSRMQVSSRGEVDARGSDEASWAEDRRVDIKLMND